MISAKEMKSILEQSVYTNHNEHVEKISSEKCAELVSELITSKIPLKEINAMLGRALEGGFNADTGEPVIDQAAQIVINFLKDMKNDQ
jgi:uncharacterized membrane-anchored protein YjiN (DUF445 family)